MGPLKKQRVSDICVIERDGERLNYFLNRRSDRINVTTTNGCCLRVLSLGLSSGLF